VEFNQALSERRVNRVKSFLVEQGVPEANIETKAFGKEHNLTTEEVKGEVESNPELSPEERQRVLKNIVTIRMASNRRVDVTLSTTGLTSVRQFPFNAADALTLIELASDFKKYLESKPDAHLILGGHADHRGSVEFNQALSERRVARTKSFLVEQGVPEASIETKAFGKEHNLTTEEVQGEVQSNTELTAEERARVLRNIVTIRMASNRRVDVTLSTTGQTSVRQFPFNATDALTLIGGREAAKKPAAKKPVAKKPAPKK
jgi:outer membrane protein OmpA-like peptidoglycan-associated protein